MEYAILMTDLVVSLTIISKIGKLELTKGAGFGRAANSVM